MPSGVVHWEIHCKDYPKMKGFYSQVFSWNVDDNNPMKYGLVQPGGPGSIGGGMAPASNPPGFGAYLTFYISVDDLQKALDAVEKAGGKTLTKPTPIPGIGSYAMFADPDGNKVGLFKA